MWFFTWAWIFGIYIGIMNNWRNISFLKPRTMKFWEMFSDKDFKTNFRMSRSNFTTLNEMLQSLNKRDTNMRGAISLEKRNAVALYALGSSADDQSVSYLFDIENSTVSEHVLEFSEEVLDVLSPQYMNAFPLTRATIEESVEGFKKLGFPQCLGAIDSCHIEVHPNEKDAVLYCNNKNWHSIILLALVDARCRFMYINDGAHGRQSDSDVYEESKLKKDLAGCDLLRKMSQEISNVDVPIVILGDSAFRFSSNLMKPYRNVEMVQENNFNYALSESRLVVETAFVHLKARFCRIGKGSHVDYATKIIKACCVLHNFLIENNDDVNEKWLQVQTETQLNREQPKVCSIFTDQQEDAKKIRHALALRFTSLAMMTQMLTASSDVDDDSSNSDADVDGNTSGGSAGRGVDDQCQQHIL